MKRKPDWVDMRELADPQEKRWWLMDERHVWHLAAYQGLARWYAGYSLTACHKRTEREQTELPVSHDLARCEDCDALLDAPDLRRISLRRSDFDASPVYIGPLPPYVMPWDMDQWPTDRL